MKFSISFYRHFNKTSYKSISSKILYDYKNDYRVDLAAEEIIKLKSLRFINTVISLVNVYLNSNLKSKNNYVYTMISHPIIRTILKKYWMEIVNDKTKFQILILKGI